jgi:hypothetical protein
LVPLLNVCGLLARVGVVILGGRRVVLVLRAPLEDLLEESTVEKTISANQRDFGSAQMKPKTYVQQLSLWTGVPKETSLLKLFFRPFPMIAYPAVAFSFLGYA